MIITCMLSYTIIAILSLFTSWFECAVLQVISWGVFTVMTNVPVMYILNEHRLAFRNAKVT